MGRPSKYPEEFRREAVALRRSSDRPRCRDAEDLGIADGTLAAWEKEFPDDEADALDVSERAELARFAPAPPPGFSPAPPGHLNGRDAPRDHPCISTIRGGDSCGASSS